MALYPDCFLILLTAILLHFLPKLYQESLPVHIEGKVSKGFESVQKTFREFFELGWEEEGAAFAVYKEGKLVVDLWGGYADKSALRLWRKDTLAQTMSTTKAVSSLCIALLVDRGYLNYSSLVSDYWPKFANGGKHNITVQMLMSHQAGLAWLDDFSWLKGQKYDSVRVAEAFECQKPNWAAGTGAGYHAFTFGWLMDILVQKVDPKKRNIAQFFQEEIAQPYDIDFHIWLPQQSEYRVARVSLESFWGVLGQALYDRDFAHLFASIFTSQGPRSRLAKVLHNVPTLADHSTIQRPRLPHQPVCYASCGGLGTARSLAKALHVIAEGTLIGSETTSRLKEPIVMDLNDFAFGGTVEAPWGLGFMYSKRPGSEQSGEWIFGHSGYGGQYVKVDLKYNVSYAYVTNSMKSKNGDQVRTWNKLEKTLYEVLNRL